MKILIIVSSTAQLSMFKVLIKELQNFNIKFINTGIPFKKEINKLLERYGVHFETIERCNIKSANEVLIRETPDIILTGHDQTPMEIFFIEAANSLGIPSLTVQDGIINAEKNTVSLEKKIKYFLKIPLKFINLFLIKKISLRYLLDFVIFKIKYHNKYLFRYGHGDSTLITLFGESTRKILISEGINPKKLVVTGNPKFDKLKHFKNTSMKDELRNRWNIPKEKFVVLLLTQQFVEAEIWVPAQREELVSVISQSVSDLKDAHLIIKLHPPYEKEEDYIKILKKFSISYNIFNEEPLEEILSLCDVTLTVSSTAALEAMALTKPVMIINLFNENQPLFYRDSGAMYITKKSELKFNLKNLSLGKSFDFKKIDRFLFEQTFEIDGKASKRIANLIVKMIK